MNQVKTPSSMLESLQPAPRGVLKYSGWILLQNAQVQTRSGCIINTMKSLFKWHFLLFRQLKWQQHKRWDAGRRAGELSAEARLVGCDPEGPLLHAQSLCWWDETFPCCRLVCYTLYIYCLKNSPFPHRAKQQCRSSLAWLKIASAKPTPPLQTQPGWRCPGRSGGNHPWRWIESVQLLIAPNIQRLVINWSFLTFWFTENKKQQLVSNLRGLSVSERLRKLRAMPLSLADKMEIRYQRRFKTFLQKQSFITVVTPPSPVFY